MAPPRLIPVADSALLVAFGSVVDDALYRRVLALDRALAAAPPPGFAEAVPAFVNLLVRFDPLVTDHVAMADAVRALLDRPAAPPGPVATHLVEVCYDPDLAPDLAAVAAATGLSPDGVVAAHLSGDYSVALYGFAPGYAYLSGTPAPIRLPRKAAALRGIPAGSVLIAGAQCLVTTLTMPTGWSIIGRSPTQILRNDPVRPFLFAVGDRVQMRRISRARFDAARRAP